MQDSEDGTPVGLETITFPSAATYTLVEEIGRGGMGIVYLAEKGCAGVTDLVALKTIKTISKEHAELLAREANTASQLRHENIVKTYGLEMVPIAALPPHVRASLEKGTDIAPEGLSGTYRAADDSGPNASTPSGSPPGRKRRGGKPLRRRRRKVGQQRERTHLVSEGTRVDLNNQTGEMRLDEDMLLLIAMDYIEGTDLLRLHMEHLKAGYLIPAMLTAYVMARVARALDYAHNFVVHRDISPENVLINNHGVCKLTDFGIGVAAKEGRIRWGGKLSYMSPEQIFSKDVDERADIYSLGLVAFTLATGIPVQAPPKKGTLKDRLKVIKRQLDEGYPPPHRVISDVPRELSDIISKCISYRPEDRYLRAAHVASELEHKVLYAKGFGPSNESLAAYVDIFESGFTKYDENQLELLSFLEGEHGLQLRRRLSFDKYTRVGRSMISERSQYYICRKIAEVALAERTAKTRVAGRPVLRVRLRDSLVESWGLAAEMTIGSDPRCGICVEGPGVQPRHAKVAALMPLTLRAADGELFDRQGLEQHELVLREGDRLDLGQVALFFLHEQPLPAPEKRMTISEAPPSDLLKLSSFQLEVRPNDVELLYDFWQELALQVGLGEQKQFLLANSLVEFIDLLAYGNEPIRIAHHLESGHVRFHIDCSASEVGFGRFVDALHAQLKLVGDEEAPADDPRFAAIAMVRKVFDRIAVDRSAFALTLVKNYG